MKKMVLIGGGENGRVDNGILYPYDTESIDREIIKLTNKDNPNFLFINHAFSNSIEIQESYYQTMKKIYGDMFNCNCRDLKSNELDNMDVVKEKIEWADIIYEGGGDTSSMIKLWRDKCFDKILYKAYTDGKVISGISAGAVCYFNSCNSDTENGFEVVDCLNWFNCFMTPHINENGRYKSTKEQLEKNNLVGIMLSNIAALEILDDKYRILLSDYDDNFMLYAKKGYYKDGVYKEILLNTEYNLLNDLFDKNIE